MKLTFFSLSAMIIASSAALASTEPSAHIRYSANKMIEHKGTNVVELKGNAQVLLNGALSGKDKIQYFASKMISHEQARRVELIGKAQVICGREKVTGDRITYTALPGGDVQLTADDLKVELPPKGER